MCVCYSNKTVFEIPHKVWQVQQKFKWISSFYHKYILSQLGKFSNFVSTNNPKWIYVYCAMYIPHYYLRLFPYITIDNIEYL